jgi:hypothetical protein
VFQAQLLIGATSGTIYSPWFERRGDWLRATVEVITVVGSTGITVTVLTKDKDEVGDGTAITAASSDMAQTTAGRKTAEYGNASSGNANGIKQLVRYKYNPGTNNSEWVLFRMLPPVWFDATK